VSPLPARKPCLGILLWAIPGIFLSERFPCSLPLALCAVVCFAVSSFLGRRAVHFGLLALSLFFVRHDLDWRESAGRFPLDLQSRGIPVIQATGIVTTDAAPAGYAWHMDHSRFEMRVTGVAFGGRSTATDFPAEVLWTGIPPAWGDEISFTAAIAPISPPRNPGEVNFAAYLARDGLFAQLSCDYPEDGRILAHNRGNPLLAWARSCRFFLQRRLSAGIAEDAEIAGLVQTITLGLKEEIALEDRELFQHVGALHLFVVNGLHVALLAGILGFLVKPFGVRRRLFALVIIPILFAYALITGASPGSIRAATMASVVFGASFVERRPFSYNSLAAAALILLMWDTNELFRPGAQFSFGVVAAIVFLARPIQSFLHPFGGLDPFLPRSLWTPWQHGWEFCWRRLSGLAAVSVAASAGSFPFSAGYFNIVTPSGFLANLLLVPLAFCILAEAIFSILASAAGSVAVLFNNVNWLLAWTMLHIVRGFALLPGGYFYVSTQPALPECRITVLDLNPGQAVVIQSEGAALLADCGSASSYLHSVRPFLQSRGVNRLDGLILTRGAPASIGAAPLVITDFAPRVIILAASSGRSAARRALEDSGQPLTLVAAGDRLRLSPAVTCTVLFPPAGFVAGAGSDKSMVLNVAVGRSRVLLMSDSAFTGEHWLLDHSGDLRASIVVLGGQSADLAGTGEFIGAVHPFAVVRGAPPFTAAVGDERRWAAGMYRRGVTPFLQSASGAVTIDLSQSGAALRGFMGGQTISSHGP